MGEVKKQHQSIRAANTRVYALTTDAPHQSRAVMQNMDLPFDLLCDTDKQVTTQFGLLNPHEHDGIPYPALFVINPQGRVCYRSLDQTASRVDLTEVLEFLKQLHQEPDHQAAASGKRQLMRPSLGVMWQISRNMVLRGNRADWKHYFAFPVNALKLISKKIKK